MSNFYYCNDCKSHCDLILPSSETYISLKIEHVCNKCGSTNWHAEIDKAVEQLKEKILNESVSGYPADIVDKNFKELFSK